MTYQPIVLRSDEVIAIREGHKTQLQRPIVPKPVPWTVGTSIETPTERTRAWSWRDKRVVATDATFRTVMPDHCPFGKVGDELWVKESYWHPTCLHNAHFSYHAEQPHPPGYMYELVQAHAMPHGAHRMALRVTDTWVQRVQDTTYQQAVAEGMDPARAQVLYMLYWERVHLRRRLLWRDNPWTWALSFTWHAV
jgi:hypothetical protein